MVLLLWKKKGDDKDLDNYRGICLLTIITTLASRILARRLQTWAEKNGRLVNQQFGFRAYRSTRDAILIARLVFEAGAKTRLNTQALERLVMILYDIKKAYPNVPWELFWALLRHIGIPEKTVLLQRRQKI